MRNRILEEKRVRSTKEIVNGDRTRLRDGPLEPRSIRCGSTPESRRQSVASLEHLLSSDREEDWEPRDEVLRVTIRQRRDFLITDQDGGEIAGKSVASRGGIYRPVHVAEEVHVRSGETAVRSFHSDGRASREIMLVVEERLRFGQKRAVGQLSDVATLEREIGIRVVRIHRKADAAQEEGRRNRSYVRTVLLRYDDGVCGAKPFDGVVHDFRAKEVASEGPQ